MNLDRQAVERRLSDKNQEDAKDAKIRILLGFPFGAASFLALTMIFYFFFWLFGVQQGCMAAVLVTAGLLLVASGLDFVLHRSQHWHQTRIYRPDGRKSSSPSKPGLQRELPEFLENVRFIGGKLLGLVLGGPRNIRGGLDLLKLIRVRSHTDLTEAGTLFIQWLRQKGSVPEAEVDSALAENARLSLGYEFTTELGLLEWKKTEQGRRFLEVRSIQGIS